MPADEDAESGQLSIWLDTEMTASRRKKPPYTDGLMKILVKELGDADNSRVSNR